MDYVVKHDEFADYAKLAAAGYVVDLFPARAFVTRQYSKERLNAES